MERVRNGSLTVIGMVGEVEPQHLVLPITIEPKNPRMCHDERFLNHGLRIVPLPLTTSRICHVTSTKIITKLHSTIKAGMTISSSTHLALRILVWNGEDGTSRTPHFPSAGKPARIFIIRWLWLQPTLTGPMEYRALNILTTNTLASCAYHEHA